MQPPDEQRCSPSRRRARGFALGSALALLVAARFASIFTVGVNWDEFALMSRVHDTAETGVLHSGGRPGLATLVLLPFAAGCSDEIAAIRAARALWLALTLAGLAGVGALVFELSPDARRSRGDAALAVALLAGLPAFLEWSIQVRTDQIALLGGVWGSAALLASRRRPPLAALAGLLFALGFAGSQKLLYVAALAGLLAAGQLWVAREWRPRREAWRALACAGAFALALAAYEALLERAVEVPPQQLHAATRALTPDSLRRGFTLFEFYRNTIGWSQYAALLPTLVPHGLLLAGLAAASLAALRGRGNCGRALGLAWAVLGLGAAVGSFHAAAFAYFWMTLGLFPAVALALARGAVLDLLAPLRPRLAGLAIAAWCLALGAPALAQTGLLLLDSQRVQRESLAFVHRNFAPQDAGFQPESALFCGPGRQPIGTHFSQTIYRHYALSPAEAERNQREMLETHRQAPIKFLVESFRLNQFPVELRRFWAEHYQPYRASVFVAGRRLAGAAGSESEFELIVPGEYRWLPFAGAQALEIDGLVLRPGEIASFGSGRYRARFAEDVPGGMLVLALRDAPGPAPLGFYKDY